MPNKRELATKRTFIPASLLLVFVSSILVRNKPIFTIRSVDFILVSALGCHRIEKTFYSCARSETAVCADIRRDGKRKQ